MALTDIINKINADAESESARLAGEAKEEAQAILDEATKKATEILESGKTGAEQVSKETHDRTMAAATYRAKFASQGFQAKLIDQSFEEVEKRLATLPEAAYRDFVTNRAKALPKKEGALTVSKERRDETLKALKEAGVDTDDAKEADMLGGFILETKNAEYDHSLKEVARQARQNFGDVAAHILFN